jgi:hypothetical protein
MRRALFAPRISYITCIILRPDNSLELKVGQKIK